MRSSRLLCGTCRLFAHLLIGVSLFAMGILVHECGHGLLAVCFGAQVTRVNVMGVQVWPALGWDLQLGYWGRIWWRGDLSPIQRAWVRLGGNLATGVVSLVALPVFLLAPRAKYPAAKRIQEKPCAPSLSSPYLHTALLTLSLFFLDTLSHTLPTLSIPMYLFFGKRDPSSVSEGYLAATVLGCPGWLFQAVIIGYSLFAALSIARKLTHTSSSHS